MKVGLQTWGSDGDILPFFALAGALRRSGAEVTVAYTSVDGKIYAELGKALDVKTINASGSTTISGFNLYSLTGSRSSLKELAALLKECYDPVVDEMYRASTELCKENDLVIGHVLCHTLLTASQLHDVKRVVVALTPQVIRTVGHSPFGSDLGAWINRVLWNIGDHLMTRSLFASAAEIRKMEGLPSIKSLYKELFISEHLTLIAASRALCVSESDWNDNIRLCGSFSIPSKNDDMEISGDVQRFVDEGDPPIYMTFGSCDQFDPEGNAKLFIETVRISGVRAIIQSTRGNHTIDNSDQIMWIEKIPHDKIFPFCALIVHHGGAGTTHAAIRAGTPSVVVAHAYDQPSWGKRLHKAGVAGRFLFRKNITAKLLAKRINAAMNSSEMRSKAIVLAEIVSTENGVETAAELIMDQS